MALTVTPELLQKFYAGQCTREEHARVLAWLQVPENESAAHQLMNQVWERDTSQKEALDTDFAAIFSRVNRTITERHQKQAYRPRSYMQLAAGLVGILLVIGALFFTWHLNRDTTITVATTYGQTKTVRLPDHSVVTLNGNSQLTYNPEWPVNQPREIWLTGEGFFSVTHTKNHQRFVVHTAPDFQVEVLGTQFNVAKRPSGTQVVLNSGKIKLKIAGTKDVYMKPGELVSFKKQPVQYAKKQVNPKIYSAWKQQKILLDNTPLREILLKLEDTYGFRTEVTDSSLLGQKASGSMPTGNPKLLLQVIAETYDLKVVQTGNRVIFQSQ